MSIRARLLIAPALVFLSISILVFLYSSQSRSSQQLLERIYTETFATMKQLAEVKTHLASAHTTVKELSIMAMMGVAPTSIRQHAAEGTVLLESSATAIRMFATTASRDESETLKNLDEYLALYDQVTVAAADDGDAYGATQIYPALDDRFQAIDAQMQANLTYQQELVASDYLRMTDKGSTDSTLFLTVAGLSILLPILLTLWIAGTITRTMTGIILMLKDIAQGEGDLTKRLRAESNNEFGELARWFNQFMDRLQDTVQRVAQATDQVMVSAEQVSHTTEQTIQGMAQQRQETDQVAVSINEMVATVQEVAQNTSLAAQSAGQANDRAGEGAAVVSRTIDLNNRMARELEQTRIIIDQLEQDSTNIGTILGAIEGIAEQTNLLALNAAIEAARAGEQGRGFAVVADEVRTLSKRTQTSTLEIKQLIDQLQSVSKNAAQAMDQSRQQAQLSVEQAQQAGTSLQTITEVVASINDMNIQIATSSEQQLAVAEQINQNIGNISQVSRQTEAETGQVAAASKSLSMLSRDLKGLVAQFKV